MIELMNVRMNECMNECTTSPTPQLRLQPIVLLQPVMQLTHCASTGLTGEEVQARRRRQCRRRFGATTAWSTDWLTGRSVRYQFENHLTRPMPRRNPMSLPIVERISPESQSSSGSSMMNAWMACNQECRLMTLVVFQCAC
eukprot:GHVU01041764.1.p2 GENE.GHVU01041764.1~~GHVU01041764.1.p2  ORF type:complete len:141 (+),score=5.64 GHVU01041764.1:1557-1979(+)